MKNIKILNQLSFLKSTVKSQNQSEEFVRKTRSLLDSV